MRTSSLALRLRSLPSAPPPRSSSSSASTSRSTSTSSTTSSRSRSASRSRSVSRSRSTSSSGRSTGLAGLASVFALAARSGLGFFRRPGRGRFCRRLLRGLLLRRRLRGRLGGRLRGGLAEVDLVDFADDFVDLPPTSCGGGVRVAHHGGDRLGLLLGGSRGGLRPLRGRGGTALLELRDRLGAAASAAVTTTVTPSLLRLRRNCSGVRQRDVRLLEGLTDILRLEETLRAPTLDQSLNDGLVQLCWLRASRTCRRHEHLSNNAWREMDPGGEAARTRRTCSAFWHDTRAARPPPVGCSSTLAASEH